MKAPVPTNGDVLVIPSSPAASWASTHISLSSPRLLRTLAVGVLSFSVTVLSSVASIDSMAS